MCITFYLLARRENGLILISPGDCNRWGMMKRYFSLLLIAAFVGGCASSTAIEAPTWTPEALQKIPITIEVEPSDTPTLKPTFTLIRPTLTFTPTATETPSLTPTATRTRPPLPTQTRTPKPMLVPTQAPTSAVSVQFWADKTAVAAGQCTKLHWIVNGVQAVFLGSTQHGVTGVGEWDVCLGVTTKYDLIVQLDNGKLQTYSVTVNVQ